MNQGIGPAVNHFTVTPVGGTTIRPATGPRSTQFPRIRHGRVRLPRQAPSGRSGDMAVAGLTILLVMVVALLVMLFKYVVLALVVAGAAYLVYAIPRGNGRGPAPARSVRTGGSWAWIGSILGTCVVGGVGLGKALVEGAAAGIGAAAYALLVVVKVAYRIVVVAFSILISILFLSFLFNLFGGRNK